MEPKTQMSAELDPNISIGFVGGAVKRIPLSRRASDAHGWYAPFKVRKKYLCELV